MSVKDRGGNTMEKEMIEHIVTISEYVQVKLKIPKELDILSFKGLMQQANQMFKLSDVPLETQTRIRQPRTKIGNEREQELLRRYNSGEDKKVLVQEFGLRNTTHLSQKANYYKRKYNMVGVTTIATKGSRERWTDGDKEKLIKLYKKGIVDVNTLSQHIGNRTAKSINHKIKNLKTAGELK